MYKFLNPRNILAQDGFKLCPSEEIFSEEPLPPFLFLAPELRKTPVDLHRNNSDPTAAVDDNSCSCEAQPSADIYSLGQVILWLSCLSRPHESLSEALVSSVVEIPMLSSMLSRDPSKRPSIKDLFQYSWFQYSLERKEAALAEEDNNMAVDESILHEMTAAVCNEEALEPTNLETKIRLPHQSQAAFQVQNLDPLDKPIGPSVEPEDSKVSDARDIFGSNCELNEAEKAILDEMCSSSSSLNSEYISWKKISVDNLSSGSGKMAMDSSVKIKRAQRTSANTDEIMLILDDRH